MLWFNKKCKGAISVFLTLILLPTFIFGGVIVDGSRIMGAKNMISGAGDLAMNAALSNYNADLNEMYGLLAMAKTPEEVEDVMKDFFECTLNAAGVSQEDFNKALIYLELTDDFSSVSVPESEIYRTEVMRQEIIEYMKYRAPITLTERIIDNEGALEALGNIQKEKNAADGQIKFESEMEDVQKLFDKIKVQTDRLEELSQLVKDEDGQNAMLKHANSSYDEIAWLTVAYKSMNNCSASVDGDTETLMREMCDHICDVNVIDESDAAKIIHMIKVQNGMKGKPEDILEGLDPFSEEYQEKRNLINEYESAVENMIEGIHNTEKQLNELVTLEYINLSNQRKWAVEGEECCIELVGEDGTGGLIQKLEKKFAKLQEEYNTWENAVNELSDGESKEAYKDNLAEVQGFFKEDGGITGFKNKIINNKTFYNEVYTQLDLVTFTGKRLDEEIDSKSDFEGMAASDAVTEGEIKSKGAEFKSNYIDTVVSLSVDNQEIESDEFVTLLKENYCKPNEKANEAEADKAAEAGDKSLEDSLKELEECFTSSDVLEGEEKPNIDTMGKGDLPSNWLGLRVVEDETEDNHQPEITSGLSDEGDRKKVSDSGSNGLNTDNSSLESFTSLPGLLSKAGAAIAKPLYTTEYIMGMFSYYTCDKEEDGSEIDDPQSLTGQSLKDNAAYRAEVEYILWGSPNVRNNVGITKAIIFTANLVFNMSFVFTNAQLKLQATKTAALFPVPPVGQVAIKCALQVAAAMVQTVKDLLNICDGKAVPLIKQSGDWDTWIPTFGIESLEAGTDTTKSEGGLTYEDYLWILVCGKSFISSDEMLARTADCIELNMTDKKSDEENSLKSMFTMVQIEASVSIDTYFLDRLNGAGYDVQKVDEETFKIPYKGIQGY